MSKNKCFNFYQKLLFGAIILLINGCFDKANDENQQLKKTTFNSVDWINGDFTIKGQMINDLVQSELLTNKSRSEVIEILGEPENYNQNDKFIYYNLDTGIKYNSDSWFEILRIEFNKDIVKNVDVID